MTDFSLDAINQMSPTAFTEIFGDIYEHSPWIAAQAAAARPFANHTALRDELARIVRSATDAQKMALMQAHPELAGKEAAAGNLTAASSQEQAGAGLVDLSRQEKQYLKAFNLDYHGKFGFPFIIAVRNHTKSTIMAAMEERLANNRSVELETALEQIFEIARLRLETLFRGSGAA